MIRLLGIGSLGDAVCVLISVFVTNESCYYKVFFSRGGNVKEDSEMIIKCRVQDPLVPIQSLGNPSTHCYRLLDVNEEASLII